MALFDTTYLQFFKLLHFPNVMQSYFGVLYEYYGFTEYLGIKKEGSVWIE